MRVLSLRSVPSHNSSSDERKIVNILFLIKNNNSNTRRITRRRILYEIDVQYENDQKWLVTFLPNNHAVWYLSLRRIMFSIFRRFGCVKMSKTISIYNGIRIVFISDRISFFFFFSYRLFYFRLYYLVRWNSLRRGVISLAKIYIICVCNSYSIHVSCEHVRCAQPVAREWTRIVKSGTGTLMNIMIQVPVWFLIKINTVPVLMLVLKI